MPWWFPSTSAPDAPYHDLMFLKPIINYAEVDTLVSNSAEKALLRRFWYFVPEMIPLSLLSSVVSNIEKELQCKPFEPVVFIGKTGVTVRTVTSF